jgi:protocatechuate 3,4-dioxygenase beta subunit
MIRLIATGISTIFISAMLLSTSVHAQQTNTSQSAMVELWSPGDSGQRMRIRGRVTSSDGTPLANVQIRVRHADSAGVDRSYHQGIVTTNGRGVYQFGSVIPGNSHRLSHVHVYIDHTGYRYVETEFYFKDDPKANPNDPNAIFLEEGNSDGEKIMYGRWDITLTPE